MTTQSHWMALMPQPRKPMNCLPFRATAVPSFAEGWLSLVAYAPPTVTPLTLPTLTCLQTDCFVSLMQLCYCESESPAQSRNLADPWEALALPAYGSLAPPVNQASTNFWKLSVFIYRPSFLVFSLSFSSALRLSFRYCLKLSTPVALPSCRLLKHLTT